MLCCLVNTHSCLCIDSWESHKSEVWIAAVNVSWISGSVQLGLRSCGESSSWIHFYIGGPNCSQGEFEGRRSRLYHKIPDLRLQQKLTYLLSNRRQMKMYTNQHKSFKQNPFDASCSLLLNLIDCSEIHWNMICQCNIDKSLGTGHCSERVSYWPIKGWSLKINTLINNPSLNENWHSLLTRTDWPKSSLSDYTDWVMLAGSRRIKRNEKTFLTKDMELLSKDTVCNDTTFIPP